MFFAFIAAGHLLGFLALSWLVTLIFRSKFSSDKARLLTTVIAGCVLCAVYITGAMINAYSVQRTDYAFSTDKLSEQGSLRIALISDCHLGAALDGERLEQQIGRISACQPDILAVTGDLVDSGTSREDMLAACAALGKADTALGVYFVPGNHDGGNAYFSEKELYDALERNGITVLADESVLIEDSFYLCGRKDAYDRSRASIDKLLEPLDMDKYIIVLDHQPTDYEAEAHSGADLVLSGHTHGGQLLPLNLALVPMGFCDKVYGHSDIDGTHFVVTSGIGALKVPLRTGTPTEFVIIDISQEQ